MASRLARLLLIVAFLAGSSPGLAYARLLEPASEPRVGPSPLGDPMDVGLRLVADGFTSPIGIVAPSDGSGRLFVIDQIGLIRVVASDGTLLAEPFLDLRSKIVPLMSAFDERGLLGLAFHPRYAQNGRFFVYYSAPLREGAPSGFDHTSNISEFQVSGDPNVADPASERILLQVDKPQFNHNGGTVAFGPDGFLYISLGDGGGADDVGLGHVEDWYEANAGGNGQDIQQNLLGSILRIDVDAAAPYGIPSDNPFAGTSGCSDGCDEIFAYGFRNPYRFSFDIGGTHRLFAGDAGQNLWEEVSVVDKGGNYGWNVKEGTHCFDTENPDVSPLQCPDTVGDGHPRAGDPLIDPVIEYANHHQPGGLGATVVGGFVYRGAVLPQLSGRYVFGDWSREFEEPDGTLFVASPRRKGLWLMQELRIATEASGRIEHYVLGFGQDPAGEIYVGVTENTGPTGNTGKVFKLVRPSGRG
jgi:glucose/arabinose dehydrogenase